MVALVGWRVAGLLCLVHLDKAISWGDLCVYHYLIGQKTFFAKSFLWKNKTKPTPLPTTKNKHKEEKIQPLSSPFHLFFPFTCPHMKKTPNYHEGREGKGPDVQSGGESIREPGGGERSFKSDKRNAKEFSEVIEGWKYLFCMSLVEDQQRSGN